MRWIIGMMLFNRIRRKKTSTTRSIKSLAELNDVWHFMDKTPVGDQQIADLETLWAEAQRDALETELSRKSWVAGITRRGFA